MREAQRLVAQADPYAELACIIDLGETVDIHPLRKKEVAERVGLCMDRLAYHQKVELFPKMVNTSVQGTDITQTFDQSLRPVSANELEVAGVDGRFVNAEATVDGKVVTIKSPVSSPKKLRYAWKDDPQRANIYGTNGLPVTPFEMKIGD